MSTAKKKESYWVTHDQRMILIKNMRDGHLENVIKMLQGKGRGKRAMEFYEDNVIPVVMELSCSTKDEDIISYVEVVLGGPVPGLPDPLAKKFDLLVAEKKRRQEEGKWQP